MVRDAYLAVLYAEAVVGLGHSQQGVLVCRQHGVYGGVAIGVSGNLVASAMQGHDDVVQFVLLVYKPALFVGVAVIGLSQGCCDSLYGAVRNDLASRNPYPFVAVT